MYMYVFLFSCNCADLYKISFLLLVYISKTLLLILQTLLLVILCILEWKCRQQYLHVHVCFYFHVTVQMCTKFESTFYFFCMAVRSSENGHSQLENRAHT